MSPNRIAGNREQSAKYDRHFLANALLRSGVQPKDLSLRFGSSSRGSKSYLNGLVMAFVFLPSSSVRTDFVNVDVGRQAINLNDSLGPIVPNLWSISTLTY